MSCTCFSMLSDSCSDVETHRHTERVTNFHTKLRPGTSKVTLIHSEWLKKCKFSEERKEDPQKIVAHWGGEFSLKMRLTLGTCLTMLAVTCSDRQTDTKTNIHRDGRELTPPKKLCLRFNNYHRNGESLADKVATKKIRFKRPHPSYTRQIMCRHRHGSEQFSPRNQIFEQSPQIESATSKSCCQSNTAGHFYFHKYQLPRDPSVELTSMKSFCVV